jgi:virginiamycin B lyase
MSDTVTRARQRAVAPPAIREHRIPTPGSKPYISVEGADGARWLCESGTSKIGRLNTNDY